MAAEISVDKALTGVSGLDDVLSGGLARERVYLLEGQPGTGKTTLALKYLLTGAAVGEKGLYITLSESDAELRAGARSHGWELPAEIDVFELAPPETLLDAAQEQSLLYSSDLELGETTRLIFEAMERSRPRRVVLDSLSEIRLLAQSSLRYRRHLLALKHFFTRFGATVLLLDDLTSEAQDKTVHSIAHGVLRLEEMMPLYGAERRRMRVMKYRGQAFRGGWHDFAIARGGVTVFPRLRATEHHAGFSRDQLSSGVTGIDALLGGGVERGASTVILGPSGSGKSLLTLRFAVAAVERGERAAVFVFDEEIGLLAERAKGMGLDVDAMRGDGRLLLEPVDAAELSPGEFAHRVREQVEERDVRTVVIDSLNGYQSAMPEEQFLVLHMHELLSFLNRKGVSSFLTVALHGLVGRVDAPIDLTYLADTVMLLRYFEAHGSVRRAVSVMKKRAGRHEDTIREYRIDARGIHVGEPLRAFQGVLQGDPRYTASDPSMRSEPGA